MIAKSFLYVAACAAALVSANAASAAILIESLPSSLATPTPTVWQNRASGSNYMVRFTVTSAVDLTGFSILTQNVGVNFNTSTKFKLRADDAGKPTATNLVTFDANLTTITTFNAAKDQVLAGIDFSPIRLDAGTYWIGLSNNGRPGFNWWDFNNGAPTGSPDQIYLQGDGATGQVASGAYKLAWQLRGDVVAAAPAVPEPATWAMMMGGLGLVGASMRRRKTAVAFA